MAKISACIISFNEEKKIEDCIKSLLDVADEIIVVDSCSTDNTLKIVQKYTDKIYQLRGEIQHYSFDSISAHLQTIDKFTEIGATEIIKRNKHVNLFSPWTHAFWTFFRMYIIRRGFLDGLAGLGASVLSFMHVYIKYNKVLFAQRTKRTSKE